MPNHPPIPNKKIIDRALRIALDTLYVLERKVIDGGGRENYLNAKLRDYLQPFFIGWEVKCEHRKEGKEMKRNSRGRIVRPDVIIHWPDKNGPNVAIIEAKGHWNKTRRERDREKLEDYREKQGYMRAYQVEYGKVRGTFQAL